MRQKFLTIVFIFIILITICPKAQAATAASLDLQAKHSLEKFINTTDNAKEVLAKSRATLVFPEIYKAGLFFIGGQYGEGVLFTQFNSNSYYNIASGAFGWQLGAQKKTLILLFMTDQALENFVHSENWEIGANASVAVITVGASGSIDTTDLNKPILAFVLDQEGLMYNLTLEGTKISKIEKK